MPLPPRTLRRRTNSGTSHVSDSEPGEEARRHDHSPYFSVPHTPPPHRLPLSAISNITLDTKLDSGHILESRLSTIEGDLAEIKATIKDKLEAQNCPKRKLHVSDSAPSTPLPKRMRLMRDQKVGGDSPVGRLEEPRIHRSSLMASTPEREDIARCLTEALQPAAHQHNRRIKHRVELEYERACNEVYEQHGKDFNFLKQHSLSHAVEDFMSKGTSRNMNTRVGEGFQQEVEKMYQKTNGKKAEHQIALQDENEEAMARIKMAIDEWRQRREDPDIEEEERTLIPPVNQVLPGQWTLGSPEKRISIHRLETERRTDPAFRNFNLRLREYIASHHPSHQIRLEQQIQIEQCKVIYVDYQSKVDWRSARDILRCNPNAPRFDCIIYETDNDSLAMGELHFVFRCHLPGNAALDLAMVCPFRKTSWQPNTRTDCPIREKMPVTTSSFVALEHVVRGALICPIFDGKEGMHYVVDCVDEDMYLRVNNIN
ncbi:hypothetical protein K438DRAFT_2020332 [Mycena galopus ATCC 62051]|nr:hypothetical protein K438DRAFT_2020332 [Mycena galopus ATCC 62051]